jgi:hypothetical protein
MLDAYPKFLLRFFGRATFSKKRVYRLNGLYDELGQGQVTYEDITKTVGCMSHNSIVQTRYGVFWAGDDGFYWTDGFNFKKISDTINERYKNLVSSATRKSRIYATFDTVENKIHWAATAGASSTDNDCFLHWIFGGVLVKPLHSLLA